MSADLARAVRSCLACRGYRIPHSYDEYCSAERKLQTWANACNACKGYPDQEHTLDEHCRAEDLKIKAALDGGVPLLHAEDRKARRDVAEDAIERLTRSRDEWKRLAGALKNASRLAAKLTEERDELRDQLDRAYQERDDWKGEADILRGELKLLQEKFDHLQSEWRLGRERGDTLVYRWEREAFDLWQREWQRQERVERAERRDV